MFGEFWFVCDKSDYDLNIPPGVTHLIRTGDESRLSAELRYY
jgi:hypothetical protein